MNENMFLIWLVLVVMSGGFAFAALLSDLAARNPNHWFIRWLDKIFRKIGN